MTQPFNRILVPTDFSLDAEHAVRIASALSHSYSAPVTILHVYDPVAFPLPDGYVMYTSRQLARIWAELDSRLAQAERDARSAGAVKTETRLRQGITASEIVSFARAEGFDLIVMGTHGRTGVGRVLLGSVAARVVQTAHCPVLAVKRAKQRSETEAGVPAAVQTP